MTHFQKGTSKNDFISIPQKKKKKNKKQIVKRDWMKK